MSAYRGAQDAEGYEVCPGCGGRECEGFCGDGPEPTEDDEEES